MIQDRQRRQFRNRGVLLECHEFLDLRKEFQARQRKEGESLPDAIAETLQVDREKVQVLIIIDNVHVRILNRKRRFGIVETENTFQISFRIILVAHQDDKDPYNQTAEHHGSRKNNRLRNSLLNQQEAKHRKRQCQEHLHLRKDHKRHNQRNPVAQDENQPAPFGRLPEGQEIHRQRRHQHQ